MTRTCFYVVLVLYINRNESAKRKRKGTQRKELCVSLRFLFADFAVTSLPFLHPVLNGIMIAKLKVIKFLTTWEKL